MAIICCWPPDSDPAYAPILADSPGKMPSTSSSRGAAAFPAG